MKKFNKLIYEKSNVYRIHADNLRWVLLGGYSVFFSQTISYADSAPAGILLFLFSICYLLVLAVQNWYYNLFSMYVKDCELKLKNNEILLTMDEFNKMNGEKTNPFHESFFFAYVCVLGAATIYLIKGINISFYFSIPLIVFLSFGLYLSIKFWDKFIYKYIIKGLSDKMRK